MVSGQRLSREPDQAEKLAGLCGELPQVLELVEGVLAEHPGMDMPWMDELIRSLEASRLAVLEPVQLFWQHLKERDDQAARLLLLLSVNPGPDISTKAAAAVRCWPSTASPER